MKTRLLRAFVTIIVITAITSCITTLKIFTQKHTSENVLPAVDILVIEADNMQGYN